jgi:hypothetical protein
MDSTLEYILSDTHGFLLLHPFVPGAYDRCFPRHRAGDVYPLWEPPGMFERRPRSLPRVIKRSGRGRQVVKSRLPALIIGWRIDGVDHS